MTAGEGRQGWAGAREARGAAVQRAVNQAVRVSGIAMHATWHSVGHSFATHLLEDGTDIRPLQELFFFNDTATTEIYTLSLPDALPICNGVLGLLALAEGLDLLVLEIGRAHV